MANNPYVNKVEYAGQTLVDLTGDTATPSDVLNGVTFHDRSGAPQTGNLITHDVYDGLDSTSTTDALSANQGKVLDDKIKDIASIATKSFTAIQSPTGTYVLNTVDVTWAGHVPISVGYVCNLTTINVYRIELWGNNVTIAASGLTSSATVSVSVVYLRYS